MAKKQPAASKPTEARPLTARSREVLKGPPGVLGYAHLITPDEAFGQIKFKANIHYSEKPLAALLEMVNEAYWALVPDLQAQADEQKKKVKVLSKADLFGLFQEEKLKHPNEAAKIQEPYLIFDTNASFKDKNGEEQAITIKAFDPHGAPVDLKALKLGMESIVKPVFQVSVWAGPLSKGTILPKLRLVGLQVLKVKQFAGNGGMSSVGEVKDSDLAFLEDNFTPDDLSLFTTKPADAKGKSKAAAEPEGDDLDDEIPF